MAARGRHQWEPPRAGVKGIVNESDAAWLRDWMDELGEDHVPAFDWAYNNYTKEAMKNFLARRARKAGFSSAWIRELILDPPADKEEVLESFMTEIFDPWPKQRPRPRES